MNKTRTTLQTCCGQIWEELAVIKCRERNFQHGAVAGSSLPVTGTSWESWSGMTGQIAPGQTGSVWSFLSLWPLCWRLISAESGLQHRWDECCQLCTVKLFLTKIFLQNYHNLHRWHKRRPENVLLMNKGVYTWTCLLCIKFNWEYPGRNLKVIFPKKNPRYWCHVRKCWSYNKLQLKGDLQENKLLLFIAMLLMIW